MLDNSAVYVIEGDGINVINTMRKLLSDPTGSPRSQIVHLRKLTNLLVDRLNEINKTESNIWFKKEKKANEN